MLAGPSKVAGRIRGPTSFLGGGGVSCPDFPLLLPRPDGAVLSRVEARTCEGSQFSLTPVSTRHTLDPSGPGGKREKGRQEQRQTFHSLSSPSPTLGASKQPGPVCIREQLR